MPAFSVCIPSYNSSSIIGDTLKSLLAQTFTDFECLVVDDASTDGTREVVLSFDDPRIRFIPNARNVGYAGNFKRCRDLAGGTYVFYLANDDILSPLALQRTYEAFQSASDVAVVTRPYYWFETDPAVPVRVVPPLDPARPRIVSSEDIDDEALRSVLDSVGQISGLAFRRDVFNGPFPAEIFTAHIYPFLTIWRSHRAVFLNEYHLAARVGHSQTRHLSSIYDLSPTWTWVRMFETVFPEERYARLRHVGIDHVARHAEGLVQIRCYARYRYFLREVAVMLRARPKNLISWKFLAYACALAVLPARLIIRAVDRYKPLVTRVRRRSIALARAASDGVA
jgi:glycosyltransferase involved in cell wall biosynthesis